MSRVEQIGNCTLYHGDSLEVLSGLSGIDAVITDPPYSSGGTFRGDRAQDTRAKYVQSGSSSHAISNFLGDTRDQRSFHHWSALWASACLRAANPGAVACFFTDWRQLPISTDYLQAGGWTWRGIVPWAKTTCRPSMGRFSAQCEYVVWGSAGALPLMRDVGCLPGFYRYSSPTRRQHVTEKPIALMGDMVEICPPGGTVLDPFLGSGTTGAAAVERGRRFVGIELHPHFFDVACRRIEAAVRAAETAALRDAA